MLFLSLGSFAFGACDINIPHGDPGMSNGQYNTWRTRIANSSNAALRQAYVDNRCTIRKGPHYGGHVPDNANDPHITVRIWGGNMCHVFTKNGQQTYFPTTCF
jgi:hypothetical protein